jgi:N-acetylmuramoyl-L-alanine amidase
MRRRKKLVVVDAVESDPVIEDINGGRFAWIIDNGHGAKQPGKRSPEFEWNGEQVQFFEWEFNYDVVNRICDKLDKHGVRYYRLVPDAPEVGSFLYQRVARANEYLSDLPKIFVSVHANAADCEDWCEDNPPEGIETWHYDGSEWGKRIAEVFQSKLTDKLNWRDRGLKSSQTFVVLKKTEMPAILTETGFFNNPYQVRELMKDSVREKVADAHVEAILEVEKSERFKWG